MIILVVILSLPLSLSLSPSLPPSLPLSLSLSLSLHRPLGPLILRLKSGFTQVISGKQAHENVANTLRSAVIDEWFCLTCLHFSSWLCMQVLALILKKPKQKINENHAWETFGTATGTGCCSGCTRWTHSWTWPRMTDEEGSKEATHWDWVALIAQVKSTNNDQTTSNNCRWL